MTYLIIPLILFIFLWLRISKLKTEVDKIKEQISTVSRQKTEFNDVKASTISNSGQYQDQVVQKNNFVEWFKENPLLKIGVLMIIIGFGWFISYAFAHNWIGPVGRITLGVLVGAVITIFGTFKLGKNETQGNALTVLGSALTIITLVAGAYVYNFFGPFVLLCIVFLVSLYVSLSAVAYSSKKLAVYGLLVSLFAPLFSSSGLTPEILYVYLGVVSVATIWISIAKNWAEVISVGIVGVFLYSLPYMVWNNEIASSAFRYLILFEIYALSMLYLGVNVWSLIQNKLKADGKDILLAIANTLIILGFTIKIIPPIYQSLVIAAWMLVYAVSGFFVLHKTKNEKLFYLHSLVSVFLLAVATSIELSGPTLVIAFAIEIAIISASSFIITGKIRVAEYFSLLFIGPVGMSISSLGSTKWMTSIFHSDFVVLLVMSMVLAILGLFFKINKEGSEGETSPYHVMLITSTIYFYALIWLSTHALMQNNDGAVFASLLIYTLIGLGSHFYGLFARNTILRKYGMTLLILVVARLVFVDVWNMELVLRVITFIVLGIMFMSSAFISKNQKSTNVINQN